MGSQGQLRSGIHREAGRASDEQGADAGVPLGSLFGLFVAALVILAFVLQAGGTDAPTSAGRPPVDRPESASAPRVGQTLHDAPDTIVRSPPRQPTPTVYYLVVDVEQAQEIAATFTGGGTVGQILLAGTPEDEARAWSIIGDLNVPHDQLTVHPPRVIDLRVPAVASPAAP